MRSSQSGLIIAIAVFVVGFFSPIVSWGLLLICDAYLLVMLLFLRSWYREYPSVWALSDSMDERTRQFFLKHGFYYVFPATCEGRCTAGGYYQNVGIAIALVHAFQIAWWFIPIGIAHYLIMGLVAIEYDPTAKYRFKPELLQIHVDIMNLLVERSEGRS